MNYRHSFHAGNFADVFKHVMLARCLVYLNQKPRPYCYIDTHAGQGLYDLASGDASRTLEWKSGIGALLATPLTGSAESLLRPFLDCIGPVQQGRDLDVYPGSPMLAQSLMRAGDRLALNDMHPATVGLLRENMGHDRRVRVECRDGYGAMDALVPPLERRGLVLVDPPFEDRTEFVRAAQALVKAHSKWPTGIYAFWYPVKESSALLPVSQAIAQAGVRKVLKIELEVSLPPQNRHPETGPPLCRCGMVFINPPFPLESETKILLPFLAKHLGQGEGDWGVEWLVGE